MKDRILGLVNLSAAGFFLLCAVWQHNDPDMVIWWGLYLLAATAGVLYHLKRLPAAAPVVFGAVALVTGLVYAWRVVAEQQYFFDEEGREMMGCLLIALYMGFLVLLMRGRRQA